MPAATALTNTAFKASGGGNGARACPPNMLSLARFQTEGYRDHSSAFKNLANANVKWQLDNGAALKLIANSVDTTPMIRKA